MKPIVPILALAASTASHAQLVITEAMAKSNHPALLAPTPDTDGDWWELTNTGPTAVNLSGYTWDDTPTPALPTVSKFPNFLIQPGESIIILEEPATNVAAWKAAWGLGASTRVIDRDQFSAMGGEGFSGLGSLGDEVNLFDPTGKLVAHVDVVAAVSGKSQAFHTDGTAIQGLHSVSGKHGAWLSKQNPSDTGSPGNPKTHFVTAPVTYGKSSYHYPVAATLPGASAPVISAMTLPPFLTLVPGTGGTAIITNNRPLALADAGDYPVQLLATGNGSSTVQEFVLTILNPEASVILNEYNAVAPDTYLNGGNALTDDDGGPLSSDTHFGRVIGNGGAWVEFVVVGNGGTNPVDLRGWKIEIGTNNGSGFIARNTLVLSNHANWQSVPAGTILTFIDRNTAQGGLNSGFALRDRRTTVGDIWTNIWMGDPTYLTYSGLAQNGYNLSSGVVSGIIIDNNATQFRVKNSSGQIVYGPAGEGVAPPSGTNSKEVFELEGHPTPSVSPIDASSATGFGYDDGASESTFGHPNSWLVGTASFTQRFNVLTAPEMAVEQPLNTNIKDGGASNFGRVAVGANASLTFTVRNTGTAELNGLAITKDGTHAADFTVTANPAPAISAPLGTTTFTVTFTPTTAGSKTAAIHIANNDDDEAPFDITLTGTAFVAGPEIAVQQPVGSELVDGKTKKSFGTVKVGKSGKAKSFTIKNTGTANLTGLAVARKGTHAKDFIVTAPLKTTLAPGASTTFKVTFKPTAAGARKATLQIKSNDANENPFDIPVTGQAAK
jgi:hypothetical protein